MHNQSYYHLVFLQGPCRNVLESQARKISLIRCRFQKWSFVGLVSDNSDKISENIVLIAALFPYYTMF